ncbi:AbrB family transcriptional regulator [Acidiphilium sp.]|nr:AbrB family transcriptional regulator [Acidiphilium sp.]
MVPRRSAAARWALLAAVTAASAVPLAAIGVPSAALFAALFVATALALAGYAPEGVPRSASLAAQAVLGVVIGALVSGPTLRALAAHAVPVVLVTFATLLVSIGAGLLMGLRRDVDPTTGALALTTGGASAIVALAAELGADIRMVAVVQYLRVGLVTAIMPLVAAFVFHVGGMTAADHLSHVGGHFSHGSAMAAAVPPAGLKGLVLVGLAAPLGLLLARLTRMPAGPLLGPLIVAAAITLTGRTGDAGVPAPIVDLAYAAIGWQAGVRFTRARLAEIGRALPTALGLILLVNVICAGLGALLADLAGATPFEGYLATLPGGIYAALAMAIAARTDVTFVLAVHVLRVLLVMFTMPLFARLLRRRAARPR